MTRPSDCAPCAAGGALAGEHLPGCSAAPSQGPVGPTGPYSIGSDVWPGLSKLAEEAGETLQVIGKLIATGGHPQHWDGSDLRKRLEEELGDLLAAARFVIEKNDLAEAHVRADEKLRAFRDWHLAQAPVRP